MEETERQRTNRLLAGQGESPVMAEEWRDLEEEEGPAWESVEAEYAVGRILEWRERNRRIYGTGPRRREQQGETRRERWAEQPEHWALTWAEEMTRHETHQRRALARIGRLNLAVALAPSDWPEYRPLEASDFVPESELGDTLARLSEPFADGELDLIEWVVPHSKEHPNGLDGLVFRWGYWRKDLKANRFRDPEEVNPLHSIKRVAERIAQETSLQASQVVSFLLCNRIPSPPWMQATIEQKRDTLISGRENVRVTIEVRDPLLTTPEELARFYRGIREEYFGKAACFRPWRRRLVQFVDAQRQADGKVTWKTLHERWNMMYPQHTYSSWRSLWNSYNLKG